jgi:hypothetical protein
MQKISYAQHRFPPELIQHVVWLYFRFPPSGHYQIFRHEHFYFHSKVAADPAVFLSSGTSAAEGPEQRSKTRDDLVYCQIVGESAL